MPKDAFQDAFNFEGDALERAGFRRMPEIDSVTEREFNERMDRMAARMQTPKGRAAVDFLFNATSAELQEAVAEYRREQTKPC